MVTVVGASAPTCVTAAKGTLHPPVRSECPSTVCQMITHTKSDVIEA